MTCAVRTCAAAAVAALLVSAAAAAPIDAMDIQDVHIDKPRGQLAEIEADSVGILAPGCAPNIHATHACGHLAV